MDYLIKQEDMMDLKVEDNSDQYLFNSLLDIGHHNQQYRPEEEAQPYSFFGREYQPIQKSKDQNYHETIINELSHLYNIRTTPLHELMTYVEQAFEPCEATKKALLMALKRCKLTSKRENAKRRTPQVEKSEEFIEEVKIQENVGMSSYAFDDESQETKKKKRNRMSAQKSRDRKKEYIKQIQKINRDLKRKIEDMNSKNRQKTKPASRDFVKILLCLGITCFLNAAPQTNANCQDLVEEERPSTETISTDEPQWMQSKMESKLDLESFKKMLPMSQQKMIEEALSVMDPVESIIEIDSTPEFDSEEEQEQPIEIPPPEDKTIKYVGKRTASSCSTP